MSFKPINAQQAYLIPEFIVPRQDVEPELFYEVMNQRERDTANILNVKENAFYMNQEIINSQQWFTSNPQKQRQAYRTVVNFGALPNAGTKSAAHNITVDANTSITRIYGAATNPTAVDPNPRFIPLPYVDVNTPNNNITLYASDTNVYVQTLVDYSAFTICYIILEYLKQAA